MIKIIEGYKKRQSLIIGLLIVAFLALLFMQTVSLPGKEIKDFSIMRPVGVPTSGDSKAVIDVFENDLGDKFCFDCLYNNVYVLFVMGLVSLFLCFKKFNKGFISKIISLAYSAFALYSLLFTDNMSYILKTYDGTYIAKIVVAALIVLVSIGALVFLTIDLAKNSWFKFVNVHIFLNSICSAVMLATTSLMFMPFEFERHTASIMGFLLLPNNYKGGFYEAFKSSIGSMGREFAELNGIISIPLLLFVIGILGAVFNAGYHKSMVTPILSIVWAGLCIVGCFLNPLIVLDTKYIIYVVLAVVVIAASALNIIQHHKANAIYR